MDNELILFDEILYRELIPWLDKNKPDEKFTAKISEIKNVEPEFPCRLEVEFYRPFNQKTQYYHKLILNESLAYCNKIYHLVNADENIKLQKYWRDDILNKKIPTRLKDLGKLLKDKQYSIDYINPRRLSFDMDADHKTETYIMQMLKVALIRCYIEIQFFFPFIQSDELFIEDDFYTRFLFEPVPEESFIKKAPQIIKIPSKPIDVQPQQAHKTKFIPILDDNRPSKKGVASFHDAIRNPQRFVSFEEKLFLNDFISAKYAYCGKQGYKNQLAIIFHLLIEKNYFNSFNDSTKKKITPRDTVKFLNHRYDVDVDKQFRFYKDKPEERAKFIETAYWLYQLPMC